MLIEFTYGILSNYNYQSSTNINDYKFTELIKNWGNNYSKVEDYEYQLVDIDNTLLFSLLTAGLPDKFILFFEVSKNKLYFVENVHTVQSSFNGSFVTSNGSKSPSDMFDYGQKYYSHGDGNFIYEVPDECFSDLYDIVKPYYEYHFTKSLVKLCQNSFNFLFMNFPIADTSFSRKKERYMVDSSRIFWEVLVNDIENGYIFENFKNKYPKTVHPLLETFSKVQNHYLTTGNYYYDPTDQS